MSVLAYQFPKQQKIKNKRVFRQVLSCSKKLQYKQFSAFYRKGTHLTTTRLGIIVKKRFNVSAVSRNLIKRIIRESFRQSAIPYLETKLDIIVLVSTKCDSRNKTAIRSNIDHLWTLIINAHQCTQPASLKAC